jgi:hypothetical protein
VLTKCLEDLERRIDETTEDQLYADWLDFTEDRFSGDIFSPARSSSSAPGIEWPDIRVNESLDDFDLMALQQFRTCSAALEGGSGGLMCVRSNYGTGILPSLFGAELFIMPEETNTLPTTRPLGGIDKIEALVDAGVPDLTGSLGGRALRMGERYAAIAANYPKIAKYVHVYHPDIQGPMDVCEMLWGSSLFVDLVDKPDLVKALLELVTETHTRYLRKWEEIIPFDDGRQVHWSLMHKGAIMLRDDSAMNLSPAMFDEFIKPYGQRLLDEFGGGAIHFCGRGDHYIESLCRMLGMHAIAMSQPECNDMEIIYRNTVDRGIKLIGFSRDAAMAARSAGRDLRGQVQC